MAEAREEPTDIGPGSTVTGLDDQELAVRANAGLPQQELDQASRTVGAARWADWTLVSWPESA